MTLLRVNETLLTCQKSFKERRFNAPHCSLLQVAHSDTRSHLSRCKYIEILITASLHDCKNRRKTLTEVVCSLTAVDSSGTGFLSHCCYDWMVFLKKKKVYWWGSCCRSLSQKPKSTLKNLSISSLGNHNWFFNYQRKRMFTGLEGLHRARIQTHKNLQITFLLQQRQGY